MAESVVLVAQKRDPHGSQAAKRLRKQGLIPAVVYGHKEATVTVAISSEALHKVIRHGAHLVDLQTDGKVEKARIREIQWDHLGHEMLHVDLQRTSADERITVPVAIQLRGTAPGVSGGGVLDQPLHTLMVECPAAGVPESIRVNIGELQIGAAIHVRELVLPPGVKATTDPEAIVVHVTAPVAEPEAAVGPAPESAEPEIIGRQKAAEEAAE